MGVSERTKRSSVGGSGRAKGSSVGGSGREKRIVNGSFLKIYYYVDFGTPNKPNF